MFNIIRNIIRFFMKPVRSTDINEWTRLEFGRDAIPSDFEGRGS